MPIPTVEAVLTLQSWLSPGYPVGAFAYSHGLELAVAEGRVGGAASLEPWVRDVIELGGGRGDAVLLGAAFDDWAQADAAARAFAAGAGRLTETLDQGRAFAATIAAAEGGAADPVAYPVAVGRAARASGLPRTLAAAMYLQAMAGALVSAGQRLAPVGQTEAQGILARLRPLCRAVGAEASHAGLTALSGAAFLSDIASQRHEVKHVKVFRT